MDGELILRSLSAVCDNEYKAEVVVKNKGATAHSSMEIRVLANGLNINQFTKNVAIPPKRERDLHHSKLIIARQQ